MKLKLYYFTCSPVGKYFATATIDFAIMRRETRRQLRRVLFKTTSELTLAQTSTVCAEKRTHCDHIFTSNYFPHFFNRRNVPFNSIFRHFQSLMLCSLYRLVFFRPRRPRRPVREEGETPSSLLLSSSPSSLTGLPPKVI